jgi:hypothetical protein
MWYRNIITAQQGVMNLDQRLIQNAEQHIMNWIMSSVVDGDLPNADTEFKGQYFLGDLQVPNWLSPYVKSIDHNVNVGAEGGYHASTKTLSIPKTIPKQELFNFIKTMVHEIRHSIDPRNQNTKYMDFIINNFTKPSNVVMLIATDFEKTNIIPNYEQFVLNRLKDYLVNQNQLMEVVSNNELFQKYLADYKKTYDVNTFNKAIEFMKSNKNLYFNNPLEHSSQMGDIKALLSKENLDAVRAYIKKNQGDNVSDLKLRLLLKNGLNPNSINFEAFSTIIQEVSGNQGSSLSQMVKGTQDPNWQSQYLKQVNNAVSVYNTDGNRFKGLVRKENLVQPGVKSNPKFNLEDNAKAIKSRAAFFSKSAQLESLVAKNPRAWSKFIDNPFASRIINANLLGMFKNLGTNSKALSQSMKSWNMQSPYWMLIEPALEFGLYQFGLYLENPNGYSLETDEQKTIKYLNIRINEILADNKIKDKREYFVKNYESYLKILGSMERNELLNKFPVMGFNQFMNIGRNIGQK